MIITDAHRNDRTLCVAGIETLLLQQSHHMVGIIPQFVYALRLFFNNIQGGYYTGGKTGTAQVYDPKTGNYSETETIGSYLGFGGQDKPRYVIMVRVDDARNGGFSGSAAAAPIFTELSNWMLDYLQIQPKG